jgi:thiol-disulfide isomerase/thioredoxin
MFKQLSFILIAATFIIGCSTSKSRVKTVYLKGSKTPIYVDDNKDTLVVGTNIGNLAPEIAYPSPNGDTIKLSSLNGNVVLIDFWASWCRPCRWENRNLVQTVKHFESAEFPNGDNWYGKEVTSTGFKVFSVSLDQNKSGWEKAIQQDKLNWPWHVSDLKGWRSKPARTYRVSSIPTNFLIDGRGVIIAKNLRGKALDNMLEKYRVKSKDTQTQNSSK